MSDFKQKYGPWALVAGGALGIGEAFSRHAASQGLNVIAIDFNQAALDDLASALPEEFGVECLPIQADLSADDALERITTAVGDREVGLLVYNAALSDVGPFYKPNTGLDWERKRVAVNVSGPMQLTYHYAKPMLARRAGGVILMSSGVGLQGSPYYSAYSATKAYSIVLAEALWYEFKPYDVDVLAVAAGLTLSSALSEEHLPEGTDRAALQTVDEVIEEAMASLGKIPLLIPGEYNRASRDALEQLPREQRVAAIAEHAITNFLGGSPPEQAID